MMAAEVFALYAGLSNVPNTYNGNITLSIVVVIFYVLDFFFPKHNKKLKQSRVRCGSFCELENYDRKSMRNYRLLDANEMLSGVERGGSFQPGADFPGA